MIGSRSSSKSDTIAPLVDAIRLAFELFDPRGDLEDAGPLLERGQRLGDTVRRLADDLGQPPIERPAVVAFRTRQ